MGFSDAAVYRHFKNKAQILEHDRRPVHRGSAQLLAEIESCDCPSPDKIKLFFLDRCRVFSGNRVLATVMFAENLFQNDPALAAKLHRVLQDHRRLLLAIIRNGQRRRHDPSVAGRAPVHHDHGVAAPAGPAMAQRRL